MELTSKNTWENSLSDADFLLELKTTILPPYINSCRWFAGKARQQEAFDFANVLTLPIENSVAFLVIVSAKYQDGEIENYLLPLSFVASNNPNAGEILPKGIISVAYFNQVRGLLVDALYDERFQQALFKHLVNEEAVKQTAGSLGFERGKGLAGEDINAPISSRVLPVDSSNSALIFGDKYFMKLYRKLFVETNPEVDMVSFLTQHSNFAHIPAFAGSVIWKREGIADITLGMMQRMVQNQQDSWGLTGDYLNDFMKGVPHRQFAINEDVFESVALLGKRTGEMHLSLYAPNADEHFAPENLTDEYRQFLHKRFTNLLDRRYNLLIDNYLKLDVPSQKLAWIFMEAREMIEEFLEDLLTKPLDSLRIRIHGDYHLGQVLATGNDYIIIDFEGEPESSISERKIKHSPLKDVAGMIRSYHYAVCAKLFNSEETKDTPPEKLQIVSDRWFKLIKDTYLEAYFGTFGYPHPLFKNNNEINFLLLIYLLEKAVYELGYEISYRPDWVKIPLKGIVDVVREIEKLKV